MKLLPSVFKFKSLLTVPVVTILSLHARTLSISSWTGFTSIGQNAASCIWVVIQDYFEKNALLFLIYTSESDNTEE